MIAKLHNLYKRRIILQVGSENYRQNNLCFVGEAFTCMGFSSGIFFMSNRMLRYAFL